MNCAVERPPLTAEQTYKNISALDVSFQRQVRRLQYYSGFEGKKWVWGGKLGIKWWVIIVNHLKVVYQMKEEMAET